MSGIGHNRPGRHRRIPPACSAKLSCGTTRTRPALAPDSSTPEIVGSPTFRRGPAARKQLHLRQKRMGNPCRADPVCPADWRMPGIPNRLGRPSL